MQGLESHGGIFTRRTSLEFNLDVCSWRNRSNLVQFRNSSSDCLSMPDKENCVSCLQDFLDRAREVEENFEDYSSILRRYDCDRNYSMWGCGQCKVCDTHTQLQQVYMVCVRLIDPGVGMRSKVMGKVI